MLKLAKTIAQFIIINCINFINFYILTKRFSFINIDETVRLYYGIIHVNNSFINITNCAVSYKYLKYLIKLNIIMHFKNNFSCSPEVIDYIKNNPNITTIQYKIYDTTYIINNDYMLSNIIYNCCDITSIIIHNHGFNNLLCYDNLIHMIFSYTPKIISIDFYNIKITDITLCEISHRYPNLKEICITTNNTTNSGIYELVNKCVNIKNLSLIHLKKKSNKNDTLSINLLNLRTLNLIIHKLTKLTTLYICVNLKSMHYESLIHELTYLNKTTKIHLNICNYTSKEFYKIKLFCKKNLLNHTISNF